MDNKFLTTIIVIVIAWIAISQGIVATGIQHWAHSMDEHVDSQYATVVTTSITRGERADFVQDRVNPDEKPIDFVQRHEQMVSLFAK